MAAGVVSMSTSARFQRDGQGAFCDLSISAVFGTKPGDAIHSKRIRITWNDSFDWSLSAHRKEHTLGPDTPSL